MRNRISRVGIELEGGWLKLPPNTTLARDGSVFRNGPPMLEVEGRMVAPAIVGELPSPPLPTGAPMRGWMKKFYPSHVDATCGLHVHMSFKSALHYQKLMCAEYTTRIIEHLMEWAKVKGLSPAHPIWPRLRGENEYCIPAFYADQQASTRSKSYQHGSGSRYTFINYPHRLHSTVECRGLPMMETCDLGIEAVEEVILATNAFLLASARREIRLKEIIPVELGTSKEIYHDIV
jgi:hypothetical protein